MSIINYRVGLDHGEKGLPRMCHRPEGYTNIKFQISYDEGYLEGVKQAVKKRKKGKEGKLKNMSWACLAYV